MADEIAVLGITTSSRSDALHVYRAIVRLKEDGAVEVEALETWRGTPRDEARSMKDLADALANSLDNRRPGAPEALALKRTESTGRPTVQYDQKIRAEGVAMVAASGQGRRYFHYRTQQLGPGADLATAAAKHPDYPRGKEAREAVAAACAALARLRGETA
jgi:hypothetical protein